MQSSQGRHDRREEDVLQILSPALRERVVLLVIGLRLDREVRWQRNLFVCGLIVRRLIITSPPLHNDSQVIQSEVGARRNESDAKTAVQNAAPRFTQKGKQGERNPLR